MSMASVMAARETTDAATRERPVAPSEEPKSRPEKACKAMRIALVP